jgi:hypothetical protein
VDTLLDPSVHSYDPVFAATRTTYLGDVLGPALANDYGFEGRTARGLGDLRLRAKVALVVNPSGAVAALVDVALPTGRSEDFLGTGATRIKSGVAWSGTFGSVSPHASAAYTLSNGSLNSRLQSADPIRPLDLTVPDEIEWTAGLDAPIASRVTLLFDAVGRRVQNVQRFGLNDTIFRTGRAGGPAADIVAATELATSSQGDMDQAFVSVGGRFRLGGSVFANASVFMPILKNGLTPRPVAAFTLDYGF